MREKQKAMRDAGVSINAVYGQMRYNNVSFEDALELSIAVKKWKEKRRFVIGGKSYPTLAAVARAFNLNPTTVRSRYEAGDRGHHLVREVEK